MWFHKVGVTLLKYSNMLWSMKNMFPQAWCWDCSQVVEITQHDAQCPLCQGDRLRVDAGDSLKVKSIEVE